MKAALVTVVLAIANILHAQKIELGLNAGISFAGKTINLSSDRINIIEDQNSSTYSQTLSIKGIYHFKKWHAGLSVDYRCATYRLYYNNSGAIICYASSPYENKSHVNIHQNRPYYPIRLFANKEITIKHIELYTGLSVGYVFMSGQYRWLSDLSVPGTHTDVESRQQHADFIINRRLFGISAGAQAGCTWYFSERMGLNAEIFADYILLRQENFGVYNGYSAYTGMLSIPVTMGIRYKLYPHTGN